MSKSDLKTNQNPGAAALRSRCIQKPLDSKLRFIDDFTATRTMSFEAKLETSRKSDVPAQNKAAGEPDGLA